MNIYVGNLSHDATEEDLRQAFGQFGQVSRATVIKDRVSGEPRGFGFVEMASKEEAEAAMQALNGQPIKGRSLKLSEARPRPERPERSMGGDRRGGGGYRGGREY